MCLFCKEASPVSALILRMGLTLLEIKLARDKKFKLNMYGPRKKIFYFKQRLVFKKMASCCSRIVQAFPYYIKIKNVYFFGWLVSMCQFGMFMIKCQHKAAVYQAPCVLAHLVLMVLSH